MNRDQESGGSRRANGGPEPWRICIDTGGTFTDCIARAPDGRIVHRKVLSSGRVRGTWSEGGFSDPQLAVLLEGAEIEDVESRRIHGRLRRGFEGDIDLAPGRIVDLVAPIDAPRLALHLATKTPLNHPLPPFHLRIATTRATNALLERATAPVILVTTEGFEDLVLIGDQTRPDLFALDIQPPRQTPVATVPLPRSTGETLPPAHLDEMLASVRAAVARHENAVVAVSLLHAWRDSSRERAVIAHLRHALPDVPMVAGTERSPSVRLLPRTRTAIADASLAPIMRSFFDGLDHRLDIDYVDAMTSHAGLVPTDRFRPCEALLSGPAAGVLGAIAAAGRLGIDSIVTFDMGGTSTDVARATRRVDLRDETTVGEVTVRVPSVDIDTIAAGGGSICQVLDGRLEVGPRSAGADPGPACYGAGGPLTLTDVNLLLGRLDPSNFGVPIDRDAATGALRLVASDSGRSEEELLHGFAELADERMAEAIRNVATRRGVDPADHTLVAFGGAGGQHACGVATRLGIDRIVIPSAAGLLSADGLAVASRQRSVERTVLSHLERTDLDALIDSVEREAIAAAQSPDDDAPRVLRRQWRCRRLGGEATIDLEFDDATQARSAAEIQRRFHETFESIHGYRLPADAPIEVAGIRVFAGASNPRPTVEGNASPGAWITGPTMVADEMNTLVVDRGWRSRRHGSGDIEIQRVDHDRLGISGPAASEILACRIESIASDMGELLRRTASSVNVRERLDYSCAIVDAHGHLVVNAPHVPVHLGAMGDCVRTVARSIAMDEGDIVLVNHPAFGGSHLPDLTLISPVHDATGDLIGHVVNRAHHAEIGGTRPGSMPPDATRLEEEGVVFPPCHLARGGVFRWDEIEHRLRHAAFPSRAVAENLADLAAQAAANRLGCDRLRELHLAVGPGRFASDLEAIRDRCRRAVERLVHRIDGLDRRVVEHLDDGWAITVAVKARGGRLEIDLTGSGPRHPGNLNAPYAVVRAAILYVLRVVAAEPIPLNDGVFDVVDLRCPSGFLAADFTGDPTHDPAVAIGNTETSQRLVDALLRAFDAAACSQGTMNNLLLGDAQRGFYETICGGAGAGPGFQGCDAIHTHMTNTRITDPEILEVRYPVRVDRFQIRAGSGGWGRWPGGSGVRRFLTATAPLAGSLLGQHRANGPYGMHGGEAGVPARCRIVRADGRLEPLSGMAAFDLTAGDQLQIETPGGGGWGPAVSPPAITPDRRTGTA